ncbi:MAG: hypothetical protein ACR2F6_05085 [Mycobacteriales bacterium]
MARISEGRDVSIASPVRGTAAGGFQPVRISAPRPSADQARVVAARLGFDLTDLDRDLTTGRTELRSIADERIGAAVAASASTSARLDEILHAVSEDPMSLSTSTAAPSSGYFFVDVPSRILTTGGLELVASTKVSFNSSAKVIRPPSDAIEHQEVIFSFPYVNASGVDQVISVTGVIGVNGVAGAVDDGGWTVFGHDHNTLWINAIMRMFAGTDDDQTLGFVVDSHQLLSIDAFEDSWPQSVGAIVLQSLVRGTALQATDVLVKAGQTRFFDFAITFDSSPPGGNTHFDFNSGDLKISGFGLFVHVTS